MRDIEFRGVEIYSGLWIFGCYLVESDDNGNKRHCIVQNDGSVCDVVPETVTEYTGLLDKNGVKIFEGDIVEVVTAYYGNKKREKIVLKWDDDIYNDSFGEPTTVGYCIKGSDWEVIGNIHDNRELLEAVS